MPGTGCKQTWLPRQVGKEEGWREGPSKDYNQVSQIVHLITFVVDMVMQFGKSLNSYLMSLLVLPPCSPKFSNVRDDIHKGSDSKKTSHSRLTSYPEVMPLSTMDVANCIDLIFQQWRHILNVGLPTNTQLAPTLNWPRHYMAGHNPRDRHRNWEREHPGDVLC